MGKGRSLSEVKIASLLDEVPVGLRSSHVEVWSVSRFVHREQLLLGHPHRLRLGFQLPLNAETEGVRSALITAEQQVAELSPGSLLYREPQLPLLSLRP